MSASASKKKRKELALSPISEKKDDKKLGKKIAIGVIAAVLAIALLITIGLLIKRNDYKVDFDTKQAAMTVGDYPVTVPMFNYFYKDTMFGDQTFSLYYQYGLVTRGQRLSAQQYMGESAVEEYTAATKENIAQVVSLYKEAVANGYTLTAEDQKAIDDAVKALKENAKKSGGSYNFFGLTYDWFCHDFFGPGCTVENYREYAELRQYASSYKKQCIENYAPSAEELTAEYEANPDQYDDVSFTLYTVSAESDGSDSAGTPTYSEDALAAAEAKAKKAVKDFPAEGTSSKADDYECIASDYTEEAAKWLFDAARKAGDISSFTTANKVNTYVIRFDERSDNSYNLVNAYALTIPFDMDESSTTYADMFKSLSENAKSGISEDDFVKLLKDVGVEEPAANSINRKTFNDEINEFLFDSARKDGDVLTSTNEEEGCYYVIRFNHVEETTYQASLTKNTLLNAMFDELYANYSTEVFDDVMANANTDPIIF